MISGLPSSFSAEGVLCSNGSSVLCRCPTPRRRAYGPHGLSLRPSACQLAQASPRSPGPVQEVSRRVWGLRLRRTDPGLALSPRLMWPSAGSDRVGVLMARFRSSIPSPPIPLAYASPVPSRWPTQNSGPSGSLLLSREDLSSSASCRFIPALTRPRFPGLRLFPRRPLRAVDLKCRSALRLQ